MSNPCNYCGRELSRHERGKCSICESQLDAVDILQGLIERVRNQ